jgi:hypothetical protein
MAHHYPGPPRSEAGLRRGGHTRVEPNLWGTASFVATPPNNPAGDAAHTNIGSQADAPAKPTKPGASEGNPRGFKDKR